MNSTSTLATGLAVLFLGTPICLGSAAAGTTVVQPLRIAALDLSGPSSMNAVVVLPPSVAVAPIAASAFRVQQGTRQLAHSVSRVTDTGLDVYVILDTAAGNSALAAEQSAASDLLRQMPPTVHTATVTPGGAVPTPQPGNIEALNALAGVRHQQLTYLPETLSAIATGPTTHRRRLIVLLTSCRADTANGFPGLTEDLRTHDQQLDMVAVGTECGPALATLARKSGGVGTINVAPDRLTQAVDRVGHDALDQYQVSTNALTDKTPVTLSVEAAGVRAATTVALAGTSRPTKSKQPSRPLLPALAVVAALILAATGVGAFSGWYRPRTSLKLSA